MKTLRRILRVLVTLPIFLGWLWPLALVALWFAQRLRWAEPSPGAPRILEATWRPWVARRWRYSTTLAAGRAMHPWHGRVVEAHEAVHTRQSEDWALAGLVLAGVGMAIAPSALWLLLWPGPCMLVLQLVSYPMAGLRGERFYRDAEMERSAYAQQDER